MGADTMHTPYRDGLESEDEFDRMVDVALNLFYKQKKRRDRVVDDLVGFGVKAVGPILYAVESGDRYDDDDDHYDNFLGSAMETLKRIGKPALPVLERYVMEDGANISVNEFAQGAIFEILDLDEEGRKEVCRHRMRLIEKVDGKNIQTCVMCSKVIESEDLQ